MLFDEVVFWLLTAMSWTAVAFLFWTLAAVIRKSLATAYPVTPDGGQTAAGMTTNDPGPA